MVTTLLMRSRWKRGVAVAFGGMMILPISAQAQQLASLPSISGFYIAGSGGANIAGSIVSQSGNTDVQTHVGPVGVLTFGYRFGNGLRAEIEGDYRSNKASSILTRRVNTELLPTQDVGGSPSTYGFMANALYDLPLGSFAIPFQPYVGVGVGYSRVDFSNVTGTEPFRFPVTGGGYYPGVGVRTSSANGAFAYQAIVGASVPISSVPGLEAIVEYRYFGTAHTSLAADTHSAYAIPYNNVASAVTNSSSVAARDSSVMFGLRYAVASSRY